MAPVAGIGPGEQPPTPVVGMAALLPGCPEAADPDLLGAMRGGVLDALSCHLEGRSHRRQGDEWAPLGTRPGCDPGARGTSMP
jgi:hypothetical protein